MTDERAWRDHLRNESAFSETTIHIHIEGKASELGGTIHIISRTSAYDVPPELADLSLKRDIFAFCDHDRKGEDPLR
jgi:hypothetical protein